MTQEAGGPLDKIHKLYPDIKTIRILSNVLGVAGRVVEVIYKDGKIRDWIIDDPSASNVELHAFILKKLGESDG